MGSAAGSIGWSNGRGRAIGLGGSGLGRLGLGGSMGSRIARQWSARRDANQVAMESLFLPDHFDFDCVSQHRDLRFRELAVRNDHAAKATAVSERRQIGHLGVPNVEFQ